MSLDIYLHFDGAPKQAGSGIFIREDGRTIEISREEWDRRFPDREPVVVTTDCESDVVYHANITHNMSKMAEEADLYTAIWHPEVSEAYKLIGPLSDGYMKLIDDPAKFKKFNPENGWGSYENLVQFVAGLLMACARYPLARIRVSR